MPKGPVLELTVLSEWGHLATAPLKAAPSVLQRDTEVPILTTILPAASLPPCPVGGWAPHLCPLGPRGTAWAQRTKRPWQRPQGLRLHHPTTPAAWPVPSNFLAHPRLAQGAHAGGAAFSECRCLTSDRKKTEEGADSSAEPWARGWRPWLLFCFNFLRAVKGALRVSSGRGGLGATLRPLAGWGCLTVTPSCSLPLALILSLRQSRIQRHLPEWGWG